MTDFFKGISPVKFEGANSTNPLAYRHYNKDEVVLGKTDGRAYPPRRRLLAHLRLGRRRPVRRPHLRSPLV